MSLQSHTAIENFEAETIQNLAQQVANTSSELKCKIEVRELDKRYTYANPKQGKCTMSCCDNIATHWLTRQSKEYCQSDMICNKHAILWTQVKNLID
ncbi:MAG: hypothetical protein AAGF83_12885 [Cyanobacteria bacterium P01_G01_bin.67]